jgi:hypothetical protein
LERIPGSCLRAIWNEEAWLSWFSLGMPYENQG